MTRSVFLSLLGLLLVIAALAGNAEELRPTYELFVPAQDDSIFPAHIYVCMACDEGTWAQVAAPAGTSKQPAQLRIAPVTITPPTPPPGVPAMLDLSASIPGPDMVYVAQVISARPIGYRFSSGVQMRLDVRRTTTFTYPAGSVVHELRDSDGSRWILIALPLALTIHDPDGAGSIDPSELDALSGLKGPWFSTYSSRILEKDLSVSANGLARVTGQSRGGAWQLITEDTEASTVSRQHNSDTKRPRAKRLLKRYFVTRNSPKKLRRSNKLDQPAPYPHLTY